MHPETRCQVVIEVELLPVVDDQERVAAAPHLARKRRCLRVRRPMLWRVSSLLFPLIAMLRRPDLA